MRYVSETHKYLKKTFWVLMLVSLPSAFALGFYSKPMASVSFIPIYVHTSIRGLSDLMKIIFGRGYLSSIYPIFIIFATLLLSISVGLSVIEKNFRMGHISIKKPFQNLNETILPVLKVILVCGILVFLYTVILFSLILLVHYLLSGWGIPNLLTVIVVAFLSLSFFVLVIAFGGPLFFVMPMMIIYGYSFVDAFTNSVSLMSGKFFKIVSGSLFPFLFASVIEYIISFFAIPYFVEVIISTLLYLYIIMFIMSYMMIVMFDLSGLERKDKSSFLSWGKKR